MTSHISARACPKLCILLVSLYWIGWDKKQNVICIASKEIDIKVIFPSSGFLFSSVKTLSLKVRIIIIFKVVCFA